jgi:hypothetical protein
MNCYQVGYKYIAVGVHSGLIQHVCVNWYANAVTETICSKEILKESYAKLVDAPMI